MRGVSWEQAGSKGSKLGYVILCFRVPTTSVGARSEGSPQLSSLTPSSLPSLPLPLSIPGSLEPPWGPGSPKLAPLASSLLPSLPACLPCSSYSQSIPGSLKPSWGLRKPSAHSPCSQLATLATRASLGL